ncbi:hypothetical protein B0T25DRAFT_487390 [Lasiosphaeria hispida]|uniref:Rhodopsin domain-containing protein n=1 Tax=Lasiosphaeria hispida TaxID=260671 RepID=A0AAJ0H9X5_9PEZI|nr:hypothetical protein B0T25DRAFT_487390 [Lasiosphaeria hispida]
MMYRLRSAQHLGFRRPVDGHVDDTPVALDTASLAGSVIACAISCWVICGVAVCARFYARGKIQHVLGPEDWCVLVAYLLALGFTVTTICECTYGKGSHIWNVTPDDFSRYLRATWVGTLFYQLSLALSKVSILLLYIRLFWFNWASRAAWVMLAIVTVYNVWGLCTTITICIPLQAYWDRNVHGDCKSVSNMWAAIGLHVATDFLIFLIPIPVVLKMMAPSWKEKACLILIFAIGFFVCIISVLRIVWIVQLYSSTDFMWDYAFISYWNCVEVNGAIILPCLVVIRPLLRKLWPSSVLNDHASPDGLESYSSAERPQPRLRRQRFDWPSQAPAADETSQDELRMEERDPQLIKMQVDTLEEPKSIHTRK